MRLTMAPKVSPACTRRRRVRLVVVEHEAKAFDSYLSPDECDETVLVRQSDGELPFDFIQRVIGRIGIMERSACHIGKAIVLLAPRLDDQSMAARRLLARALLTPTHVAVTGPAELLLAVGGDAEAALRHGLMALVETLVGEPGSGSVPIRVRFGAAAAPSVAPIFDSGVWPRSQVELAAATPG